MLVSPCQSGLIARFVVLKRISECHMQNLLPNVSAVCACDFAKAFAFGRHERVRVTMSVSELCVQRATAVPVISAVRPWCLMQFVTFDIVLCIQSSKSVEEAESFTHVVNSQSIHLYCLSCVCTAMQVHSQCVTHSYGLKRVQTCDTSHTCECFTHTLWHCTPCQTHWVADTFLHVWVHALRMHWQFVKCIQSWDFREHTLACQTLCCAFTHTQHPHSQTLSIVILALKHVVWVCLWACALGMCAMMNMSDTFLYTRVHVYTLMQLVSVSCLRTYTLGHRYTVIWAQAL